MPKQLRIVHGPSPVAGMAALVARGQREMGLDARSVCLPSPYGYQPDFLFAQHKEPKVSLKAFFLRDYLRYDVFHLYFDRSYVGRSLADVRWLKRLGKTVVLTFLGCDIRDADAEMLRRPDGMCAACGKNGCSPNQSLLRDLCDVVDAVFVTTPDLLPYAPGSRLTRLPADGAQVRDAVGAVPAYRPGEPLTVFHAPTDPVKKGTAQIVAAIDALRADGHPVELVLSEPVARDAVWRAAGNSHLVLDQVMSGTFGTFTVEMMSANVPVMAWLDPQLGQQPGPLDVPGRDIVAALKDVLSGRSDLAQAADAGRKVYEGDHTPLAVARQLTAPYLDKLTRSPDRRHAAE